MRYASDGVSPSCLSVKHASGKWGQMRAILQVIFPQSCNTMMSSVCYALRQVDAMPIGHICMLLKHCEHLFRGI